MCDKKNLFEDNKVKIICFERKNNNKTTFLRYVEKKSVKTKSNDFIIFSNTSEYEKSFSSFQKNTNKKLFVKSFSESTAKILSHMIRRSL